MSRRTAALSATLLAATTALAACADQPLPEPQPVEVDGPVPVVLETQIESVREQVAAALEAADAAADPALLQPRLAGPALELRQARYTLRRQLPDQPEPPTLSGELLLEVTPEAGPWPRFFLVATRPAVDAVPRLQLLTQATPRDPYQLTAWVTLLPGVTLPETSAAEPPEVLPADQASALAASPADVVARYADVLRAGGQSPHAAFFADDPFRAQVLQEQDAERQAVSAFFSYEVNHAPRADAVWALRTADGGALVVGVLDAARAFRVTAPGARIPLPPDLATLAGVPEVTQEAVLTSVEIVAFDVPPEGSDEPVTVLGGERGVLAVTAS